MRVVIRADASHRIGTGHLMRCLTLADMLREGGATVSFICREHAGHLCDLVEQKGYPAHRLPYAEPGPDITNEEYAWWLAVPQEEDARQTEAVLQPKREVVAWLIVDHYALDEKWERAMRSQAERVMVIDDLANRRHNCDLLLDQNLYEDLRTRYDGLLPPGCQKLLGPTYALLRPEFLQARQSLRKRDEGVKRLLIFFGGVDPTNETAKALEAVQMMHRLEITVDVVVGAANQHADQLQKQCADLTNITVHEQVKNMAKLMANADLAIGAGGTTTWERCCLGLPTLVITIAENQVAIAKESHRFGIATYLGRAEEVTVQGLYTALEQLFKHPYALREMSKKAARLVDGNGAERIGTCLSEYCLQEAVL